MKIFAILFLSMKLHASCGVDMLFVNDAKLSGLDIFQITDVLCNMTDDNDKIVMHKVSNNWARALVNKSEIIYLHKTDKWNVIAKGHRFVVADWERLNIPAYIR